MEQIKELKNAWEGDLIEYKGRVYRVIFADIISAGHTKELRVVTNYPKYKFTRVKTIYI